MTTIALGPGVVLRAGGGWHGDRSDGDHQGE